MIWSSNTFRKTLVPTKFTSFIVHHINKKSNQATKLLQFQEVNG